MQASKLVQLANAYTQSLLAYKLDRTPRPFSASFAVSNRCNIRCVYCNCPNLDPSELTLSQIEVIFSRLKSMGVKRLGLLGGEPLFRRDIIDIIALGKAYGFSLSMNTNLLMYEKYKHQLDDIDFFFTSLDGTPEKHFKNRGNQSYNKILSAIRQIISKGQKITAICVVTDVDYESTDYLLDLARKEHFNIHFQPECYDTENVLRSAPSDMVNEEIRNFWKYLIEQKRQGAPVSSSMQYLKYISQWNNYSITALQDDDTRCGAGWGFIYIDADGQAYPCPYVKGFVEGVNMVSDEWAQNFARQNPCSRCIVGPMLEFNLLFQKPAQTLFSAFNTIT